MVIKPKVRGFICINAHPSGCAENVAQQIEYIKSQSFDGLTDRPKNVLVIGASTGYGLASRITAAYGFGAKTLGLFFEKPATERKTGSAGYYNSAAFEAQAKADGLYSKSINGDAFSMQSKQQVIDIAKAEMGKIDLVIYSLASPRRTDPVSGETFISTLKPVGQAHTSKNLNTDSLVVSEVTVDAANEQEIHDTIKVMGGEDWALWMDSLSEAGVLEDGCKTVAYTYIGDKLTKPMYGDATIGKAKEHLDTTAAQLNQRLNVDARVAVLKAVVTQASSAIPVMPLYLAILFKEMKAEGTHEGCIEQLGRLFTDCLYSSSPRLDGDARYRVDELELKREMQAKIEAIWPQVTTENLADLTDFEGYKAEFLRLFGFGISQVDYEQDVELLVEENFL
jgi:enoyl-[acyl-carrier protein] reductase/trans-2-enoyl-CoA reductase (NAD+)